MGQCIMRRCITEIDRVRSVLQVNETQTGGYIYALAMAMVLDYTNAAESASSWLGSDETLFRWVRRQVLRPA